MSAALLRPFKLSPQQIAEGVECSICLGTDNADYTNHTNSTHAPWHVTCITDWVNKGGGCPECKTELKSSASKTFNLIKKVMYGTSVGFQFAFNEQMFGAFTAVTLACFIAGLNETRDVLAIFGTSCLFAAVYGIGYRFKGSELSIENNTSIFASFGLLSTIAGALLLRDSKPAQAAGALAILHNAGKSAMIKGAILGSGTSGVAGGLTKARTTPLPITLFSSLSGYAVAKAAADLFKEVKNPIARAILSGAVGGMFASSTATVLDEGYASFKEQGVAFLARRDS